MFKKGLTLILLIATTITPFFTSPVSAGAQTRVKINQTSVNQTDLNTEVYYQTTQKVTVKATYYSFDFFGHAVVKRLSLPKGTILAAQKKEPSSSTSVLRLTGYTLSYSVLKAPLDRGETVIQATTTNKKAFRRVKTPDYLPTWSRGDLYLGQKSAIKKVNSNLIRSPYTIQITSDGYIEVHNSSDHEINHPDMYQKPSDSVKINRTKRVSNTRYFYTGQKISGLGFKRINQTGPKKYQITLKDLHQPQYQSSQSRIDHQNVYYSLYQLGNQFFFTPIAETR
ncbi:hypothetical protein [Levilactobacillus bambusae]|uniref:Surface layer protein A domain-containing protein n=1 Tax=Levilactobacillus bambusae TaxID=2024736 RepID=A0A2V1N0K2_9LACO|nr:hypothetical protein [Levilactobacillus bambusae]PWG00779.1 hypothetical protein DCM90_00970 [Levilactobacillus bambusae]